MGTNSITFIHLSDIHFRYAVSNGPYDLDEVIRHELLLDAKRMSEQLNGVYGVLVTGDIAFAGKKSEYDIAYEWLNKLCDYTGCSLNHIWTVPGNHDIDRSIIPDDSYVDLMHKDLRQTHLPEINTKVSEYLKRAESRQHLFAPLEQYNVFATNFGCCSTANPLYWKRDLPLNDGSTLRLWGMNSVLVSDARDSNKREETKLILTSFQTTFLREDNVTYLTLCHHPLDWLLDCDEVEGWLDAHARLQLFGHKHIQRIKEVDGNIRVAAGAMHPERGEQGWEPRYNFISLKVVRDSQGRRLQVEIHPRVWNDTAAKMFVADNLGTYSRELSLVEWEPPSPSETPQAAELNEGDNLAAVVAAIEPDLLDLESKPHKEVSILNAGEKLTSRYMSLPHTTQKRIARNLDLFEEEDKGAPDTERYRRYFRRAKEKRLLEKLWNEVMAIYVSQGEEPDQENPFEGR